MRDPTHAGKPFQWAETYDGLRVQASALLQTAEAQRRIAEHWHRLAVDIGRRLALQNCDAVNAERATNAILTARVEELEEELGRERHALVKAR